MITATQVAFLIAGLLGGALKAWASNSQETVSKRSAIDVVIGGLAAVLVPNFVPGLIPEGLNLFAQSVVVLLISYASSDFVQNILGKLGAQASGGVTKP